MLKINAFEIFNNLLELPRIFNMKFQRNFSKYLAYNICNFRKTLVKTETLSEFFYYCYEEDT